MSDTTAAVPFRPSLPIDLDGPSGNIYAILGIVRRAFRALDREGGTATWLTASDEMSTRVKASRSYKEALAIVREYVDMGDDDHPDDYGDDDQ